ncbi:MAG: hypothetical protein QOE77_3849 [Blastocatellia bacterium]|nr:hypothetical protein [Blastocatellia bacterium]
MARPDNFFRTLNGIPVHYDRPPVAPYGSRGVAYDFHGTNELESKLDACFAELEQVCPLGRPEVLTSGGAWVDKPGFHGSGEALDLDGIHWANKAFVTLNFPTDRRFYLGIEAVLRKHFPTVLNYYFNAAHHDHLHLDLGGQIAFNRVRSKILFLQAALTYVLEIPVAIDGGWGPETSGGITRALTELNISGQLENLDTWRQFLAAVSQRAFSDTAMPLTTGKTVTVRKQTAGNAKKWFATIDDEPEFFVGREASYPPQGGKGLSGYEGMKYKPEDYRAEYGFWADFILPTAFCESEQGFFNALNTWDKAYFTFGFMQFGAHVFNGDFAKYFRGLLALPEAAAYFPNLELKDNRVHQRVNGNLVNLETNTDPTKLAKYLNPDFQVVEPVEAENAARLIHWSNNSLASRKLQVAVSIEFFRQTLTDHAVVFSLDGKPDKVCLVIADIYHHGRGGQKKQTLIKNALATNGDMEKAYRNLLTIGQDNHAPRINTLKAKVAAMIAAGTLGRMKYDAAQSDFVAA